MCALLFYGVLLVCVDFDTLFGEYEMAIEPKNVVELVAGEKQIIRVALEVLNNQYKRCLTRDSQDSALSQIWREKITAVRDVQNLPLFK